jgi:hypothetical protein
MIFKILSVSCYNKLRNKHKGNNMQLSHQALGAVMMALQNSLMNQTDIIPILQGFDFKSTNDGLVVSNPPVVEVDTQDDETADATSVFQEFAE